MSNAHLHIHSFAILGNHPGSVCNRSHIAGRAAHHPIDTLSPRVRIDTRDYRLEGGTSLDVVEAVRTRKSIRSFKPDPVPKNVLREILEIATRAPSGVNAQPWEITVVAGEALDSIKRQNVENLMSATSPNPDMQGGAREGVYRQRQVDLAKQLFQLMGIAREDKEKRAQWYQRGARFFDAPAAIILHMDSSIGESLNLFDMGTLAQTICLVALNYGLGTCIEGQGVHYPEVLRKHAGIPESQRIVTSIAIGYPDWDFPANKVQSEREPVDNITAWRGFD